MAFQHFFSRVPARMSMFNRTDSFDTFAHSEGLTREWIERELSSVYDNRPTKEEVDLIRRNLLPPVYTQAVLRSGEMVQSKFTYLPFDYTGERRAYLVHSLVLTEEERAFVSSADGKTMLNPDLFDGDLEAFDLTAPDASPDSRYPMKEITLKDVPPLQELAKAYPVKVMKNFILALLMVSCNKGKGVNFVLPESLADVSEAALRFMNGILQIFPYQIRAGLSFVTYISDYTRFPTFKVKCMIAERAETGIPKGILVRFDKRTCEGIRNEDMEANEPIVNFFYGLLSNNEVRRDFLSFMEYAAKQNPKLEQLNLKTLGEFIFLFRQCSGYFREAEVLPSDEKINEFMAIYEKHREALSQEHRIAAVKCLAHYPKRHTEIPKAVFQRVQKLYASETPAVQRSVMNVVLDLIHTDIMRDKLFTFIKKVYASEPADSKET
ncbi:MAG: hypothetical protein ACI4U2_03665, partial [Christensenellaceae bacterium]